MLPPAGKAIHSPELFLMPPTKKKKVEKNIKLQLLLPRNYGNKSGRNSCLSLLPIAKGKCPPVASAEAYKPPQGVPPLPPNVDGDDHGHEDCQDVEMERVSTNCSKCLKLLYQMHSGFSFPFSPLYRLEIIVCTIMERLVL